MSEQRVPDQVWTQDFLKKERVLWQLSCQSTLSFFRKSWVANCDVRSAIWGASRPVVDCLLVSAHVRFPLDRSVSSHSWYHPLSWHTKVYKSRVSHWIETTKGGVHNVYCRKLECNALHMHCVYSMFTLYVFLACFCDVYILMIYGPPAGRWCRCHRTGTTSPWRWEQLMQHVCEVKMPCWIAPRHRAAAVRVYTTWQCRIFTRYPRRGEQICMSDHIYTHHCACVALPTFMRFGWSVHWAGPCSCGCFTRSTPLWALSAFPASFEHTFRMDRGRYPWGRSLSVRFTTQTKLLFYSQIPQKKIDTQRFQVTAVMGTSVPGLPTRDCAESCNSSVPRCAKVSTIDVMNKTIFERLYLVQGLGTLHLRVKCPYVLTPPPLTDRRFLDICAIFFNFTEIQK